MQMPASFAKNMYMSTVVIYIRRYAYQQKHFYECQLSHASSISYKDSYSFQKCMIDMLNLRENIIPLFMSGLKDD